MSELALVIGYMLDLTIGDPRWLPHPVRMIGKEIEILEKVLRKLRPEKLSGTILALTVISSVFLISYLLIQSADRFKPLRLGVESFLIFTLLCTRSLADEPMKVVRELERGRIDEARRYLSHLVSRDTRSLNEAGILRACIETVAENTVDGLISPLFYLALGGVPAMIAFKAVSTLDSMVGYRDERYIRFGWASARLDDIANFIPARLSVLLIPFSAFILNLNGSNAFRVALRDGGKHESPNSGLPEAAFAGALGVRLGGPAVYGGVRVDRPFIGDELEPLTPGKVREAVKLMRLCSAITAFTALGVLILRG